MTEPIKWIGTPEACARLGVTLRTLYRFIDEGQLPAYKMGRVIRLQAHEVDAFIEKARIMPGTLEHLYPDPRGNQGNRGADGIDTAGVGAAAGPADEGPADTGGGGTTGEGGGSADTGGGGGRSGEGGDGRRGQGEGPDGEAGARNRGEGWTSGAATAPAPGDTGEAP